MNCFGCVFVRFCVCGDEGVGFDCVVGRDVWCGEFGEI